MQLYASAAVGGFRFSNAQTAADRVFQLQDPVTIAFSDFKQKCFDACIADSSCLGVYFLTGPSFYTCNGLTVLGGRVSATAVSESWQLGMI
jgi:hypothetical protein